MNDLENSWDEAARKGQLADLERLAQEVADQLNVASPIDGRARDSLTNRPIEINFKVSIAGVPIDRNPQTRNPWRN